MGFFTYALGLILIVSLAAAMYVLVNGSPFGGDEDDPKKKAASEKGKERFSDGSAAAAAAASGPEVYAARLKVLRAFDELLGRKPSDAELDKYAALGDDYALIEAAVERDFLGDCGADPKDPQDPKDPGDPKDPKDPKDSSDPKDSKNDPKDDKKDDSRKKHHRRHQQNQHQQASSDESSDSSSSDEDSDDAQQRQFRWGMQTDPYGAGGGGGNGRGGGNNNGRGGGGGSNGPSFPGGGPPPLPPMPYAPSTLLCPDSCVAKPDLGWHVAADGRKRGGGRDRKVCMDRTDVLKRLQVIAEEIEQFRTYVSHM